MRRNQLKEGVVESNIDLVEVGQILFIKKAKTATYCEILSSTRKCYVTHLVCQVHYTSTNSLQYILLHENSR